MSLIKPTFFQELRAREVPDFVRFMDKVMAERQERPSRGFGLIGTLRSVLLKENGEALVMQVDNLITNAGFSFISNAIGNSGSRPAVMGYIGVGTGTVAAAVTDTALGTSLLIQTATFSTPSTQSFQYATTFAAGAATGAITEAGVFNASSAGTMLDRVVFPVINKASGDTLTETFTFTMS